LRRRLRLSRRRRGLPKIVPIGQHRESFILASGPEGLLVIDQHAAHERILYERIRDRVASGRQLSQKLLIRALFEATPEEAETLASSYEDLSAAGFEIEPMSGRSWAIAALPAEATDREPAETLREVLAALGEPGTSATVSRRDRLAASVACRSAVTIRYHLAPEEIRRPARRLDQDGRPVHLPARPAGGPVPDRGRPGEVFQAEVAGTINFGF
jgi:DNA mismatch repair protein MutL